MDEQMRSALMALLGLSMVWGCSSTTAPPSEPVLPEEQYIDEYLIGIGDTLQVDVYQQPDLSAVVAVRPDGKITVPVAGEIFVGSRSPEAVSELIVQRLSEYVRSPIVTVTVAGMGSSEYLSRIRVTGAVNQPTSQPYRTGMTVLDVVLEAGGLSDFAAPSRTVIYRKSGERLKVRLDRILRSGDMSTNYPLRAGDVVTVPERIF
ncbi:MAG: polysaccharide biosynthesis/export family protein [Roseibium album]|uniref:XrtA/PEP-CTERM system exopolysaccharide export protein n=1 Tax=Roseibium album TaxID=311410 RepID=UPI0032EDB0CE